MHARAGQSRRRHWRRQRHRQRAAEVFHREGAAKKSWSRILTGRGPKPLRLPSAALRFGPMSAMSRISGTWISKQVRAFGPIAVVLLQCGNAVVSIRCYRMLGGVRPTILDEELAVNA